MVSKSRKALAATRFETPSKCSAFRDELFCGFLSLVETNLCGVHELVSKALGNALDVSEGGVTRTSADEPDGGVDATQRRHIASLTAHGTGTADTGGVLTSTRVGDSVHEHLEGVLKEEANKTKRHVGLSMRRQNNRKE